MAEGYLVRAEMRYEESYGLTVEGYDTGPGFVDSFS